MNPVCCTFFGHRDCPSSIAVPLRTTLIQLIEHHHVHTFYVGNHGTFDRIVYSVLQELSEQYPYISYYVVLAYLPTKSSDTQEAQTIYPEGIELTPKRFAILYRNRWMLDHSDIVVTYVRHSWGGAAQFTDMAIRQKKKVIAL